MDQQTPHNPWRENLLAILLTLLFGGATLITVILLGVGIFGTARAFLFLMVGAFVILFLGYFHYVVWGYTLSQQTASERDKEEQRRRKEMERQERARRGDL